MSEYDEEVLVAPAADEIDDGDVVELDDFEQTVDKCADGSLDIDIANSSPRHARYLMLKLFSTAQKEVVIYSGALTPNLDGTDVYAWGQLVEAAIKFLRKKEACLRILVQRELSGGMDHPLIQAIKDDPRVKGRFYVYVPTGGALNGMDQHFMCVDSKSYRLELEAEQSDARAVGNFNSPGFAKQLRGAFHALTEALIKAKSVVKTQVSGPAQGASVA